MLVAAVRLLLMSLTEVLQLTAVVVDANMLSGLNATRHPVVKAARPAPAQPD